MTGLVKRLREAADSAERDYYGANDDLLREAATALEALEPQRIETAPSEAWLLLWIELPNAPQNSGYIMGTIARLSVNEFFKVDAIVSPLSDDAPLSECCIWDGHWYRPMWATHWIPMSVLQPPLSSTAAAATSPIQGGMTPPIHGESE